MKRVYVYDSQHTERIVAVLTQLYGKDAVVFFNPNLISSQTVQPTPTQMIDVFFISAKMIIDENIDLMQLKKNYGTETAKIVAMSVDESFLKKVKSDIKGADFYHDKLYITCCNGENPDMTEKEDLLRSYLL